MRHVFIIGCKGIPTRYGGFETFVEKLTEYHKDKNIKYHVACLKSKQKYNPNDAEYEYHGAHCFDIKERVNGRSKAIFYDVDAIKYSIRYIKEHQIEKPIFYVLACRIGPYIGRIKKKVERLGGTLYVNPDGHEWQRGKWSKPIKAYWKLSEKLMVKHADLLICDSFRIEEYIKKDYAKYKPKTLFIPYGAETSLSTLKDDDPKVKEWYEKFHIKPKKYYLIVGRLVPENNFERIIREFMKSNTEKDLVIIAGYKGEEYYEKLLEKTHFDRDSRIKFVDSLYDEQLLKKIRKDAYGYLHGHSVGGTNPSLLEALGQTDINLLYNVSFNKEVAENGALYWTHEYRYLSNLLEKADNLSKEEIEKLSKRAKERIETHYSWEYIRDSYEQLFLETDYNKAYGM